MKSLKLVIIAVIGCMSVVFISGSAHAQPQSLPGIIANYCVEVAEGAGEALGELDEASADLADCYDEFDDCMSGLFGSDPVKCIQNYNQCINRAENDLRRACSGFLTELRGDTRRAERDARRHQVLFEFRQWLNGDSDSRNQCMAPAFAASLTCARLASD